MCKIVCYKDEASSIAGKKLVVASIETDGEAKQLQAEPQIEQAAPAIQTLKCLVVFANTTDFIYPESKKTTVLNLLFNNTVNVNKAIEQTTWGHYKLSLGSVITVNVNSPASGVMWSTFDNYMQTAADTAGYPAANFDRVLYLQPQGVNFDGAVAYAYAGKYTCYSYGASGNSLDIFVHELGHNFGFSHSGSGSNSYGDEWCVMGTSHKNTTRTATYSSVKRFQAGWGNSFPGSHVALTGDATFDIYPVAQSPDLAPGVRSVNFSGTDYFISYMLKTNAYDYIPGTTSYGVAVHEHKNGTTSWRKSVMSTPGNQFTVGTSKVIVERFGTNNSYATVSFDMNDGNTKPVANSMSITLNQNTSKTFAVTGSDANGDSLTFSKVTEPNNGTLSGNIPNLTYTPNTGFSGLDSFVFRVHDGKISSFATVSISVFSPTPPSVKWTTASQSATESGSWTVTAQLSAPYAQNVSLPFTVAGTATAADRSISASPIVIAPGATTGKATVTITADTLDENNETVTLTLNTPTNATLGTPTVHTLTITDNDATPTVTWFTASQSSTDESGTMTVTAKLSAASGKTITVPFTVTGTATAQDYTISASPITIAAGATTGTAIISITPDTVDEPNETVILTMGTPTNATKGTTTVHTATITSAASIAGAGLVEAEQDGSAHSCGAGSGVSAFSLLLLMAFTALLAGRGRESH